MWESFEHYLNLKLKNLRKPWISWRAFQMGIIDKDGKILRNAEGPSEKQIWNVFDIFIANIKRIFEKYVPNRGILRHKAFKEFLIDTKGIKKVIETLSLNRETVYISEEKNDIIEKIVVEWLNAN